MNKTTSTTSFNLWYGVYYGLLSTVALASLAALIYYGGSGSLFGKRVSTLERQKNELLATRRALRSDIAHQTALSALESSAAAQGYIAVSKPLVIAPVSAVALVTQ